MTITVKGIPLEIDMLDAQDNARATNAINSVSCATANIENSKTDAEVITTVCQAVFECFNSIFGNGTDKKIFGDKCNMREALDAFAELTLGAKKQKDDISDLMNKYSLNRLKRE